MTTPPDPSLRLLARAARRAEADPFFFARTLATYRRDNGLDDAGLAAALNCTPAQVISLALCRAPDAASPRFRAEVKQMAAESGVDMVTIVRVVRSVHAHAALRSVAEEASTYLAARDHDEPEQDEEDGDA